MQTKSMLRISTIGLLINIVLTLLKLLGGFLGQSNALISDGINSLTDIFVSILMIVFIHLATKKPDENHHYGHDKYEGIGYFLLGIIFFLTASYLMYENVISLIHYQNSDNGVKTVSIWVALISLAIKAFLIVLYVNAYRKYHNKTFFADVKNHVTDFIGTLFGLIGIFLATKGYGYFDYIGALFIGLIMMYMAVKVMIEAILFLVDTAPDKNVIKAIYNHILQLDGVIRIDDLKVRTHMEKLYVDVEIAVSSDLSLLKAHDIAEAVHLGIENKFDNVIHCMVHVNPYREKVKKVIH